MHSERFTHFPAPLIGEKPVQLLARIFPLSTPRNEHYVSTPLTSGPAKEYMGKEHPGLQTQELITYSLFTNSNFVDSVVRDFPDEDNAIVTLPYLLGKREGWGELEYNKFWMNYLTGTPPTRAREFNRHIKKGNLVQRRVFNDYTISHDVRLEEYEKFVKAYTSFIENDRLNPVSKILFMPGAEASLGGKVEKMLAEHLDIPREIVIFDREHPEYEAKVARIAPWLKDHPQIQGRGGERLVHLSSSTL